MRILGRNMAYMLKCKEAGLRTGVPLPMTEKVDLHELHPRLTENCRMGRVLGKSFCSFFSFYLFYVRNEHVGHGTVKNRMG